MVAHSETRVLILKTFPEWTNVLVSYVECSPKRG